MISLSNNDFAEAVISISKPGEPFEPTVYYDSDGDCIEVFAKTGPFYAKRINDKVTIYHSQDSNEITGALIKGIRSLCRL